MFIIGVCFRYIVGLYKAPPSAWFQAIFIMVNSAISFVSDAGRAYGFRLVEFSHVYTPILDHGQLSSTHTLPGCDYDDHRKTTFAGVHDMRVEFFVGDRNYIRVVYLESMSSFLNHSGVCIYMF